MRSNQINKYVLSDFNIKGADFYYITYTGLFTKKCACTNVYYT